MGQIGSAVYLAGSFKTAPRILTFSIAMGADYSIELIFIETYASQFIGHNKIFLGSIWIDLSMYWRKAKKVGYFLAFTINVHCPRAPLNHFFQNLLKKLIFSFITVK